MPKIECQNFKMLCQNFSSGMHCYAAVVASIYNYYKENFKSDNTKRKSYYTDYERFTNIIEPIQVADRFQRSKTRPSSIFSGGSASRASELCGIFKDKKKPMHSNEEIEQEISDGRPVIVVQNRLDANRGFHVCAIIGIENENNIIKVLYADPFAQQGATQKYTKPKWLQLTNPMDRNSRCSKLGNSNGSKGIFLSIRTKYPIVSPNDFTPIKDLISNSRRLEHDMDFKLGNTAVGRRVKEKAKNALIKRKNELAGNFQHIKTWRHHLKEELYKRSGGSSRFTEEK